ncbi:hypothetical protein OJF2_28080 [Aquisphaera giovannonii]|uniref:DNA primase/polymerase bifunctional N-terminal domain-containing protein n=1 Tax=Aquisphaera giovannonii TaxID=406548 RepID=A0A5B9W144_9BACT|nr:DUF3987 domain-containing protein [Aquisphaera giovannonii]QEH34273.1 hypothetical protein OJF2_28080 [Aquisphaera giovannonii]
MRGNSARDTALELLRRLNLWPVAIKPGEKAPIGKSWGAERPTERTIGETYKRFPRAGVGLLLGPEGGIVDIECDGPRGEDSLAELLGGEVIDTLGWSSARGPHRVFRYDDRLAKYGKGIVKLPSLPDLEIRIGGDGKQLQSNCPPTTGTDGRPREWNGNWVVADLPQAAFDLLDRVLLAPPGGKPAAAGTWTTTAPSVGNGYASSALDSECRAVGQARDGARNATLNAAAFSLGQLVGAGLLDRPTVEQRLLAAAAGYVRDDGEAAALKTIRSGLDAGQNQPRDPSRIAAGRNGWHGPRPGPEQAVPTAWPPLRSSALPSVESFPVDLLPPPVARLVRDGADAIGCPPDFLAVPALVAAAGAIGRSASLLLKHGYFASTTLFAACVGPPSDGKTPALKAATRAVRRIDEALAAEHAAAMERWEQEASQRGTDGKKAVPPPKPKPRRIDIDDATMEAIPLLLADNPRGLLMVRDELTAFVLGMNQYKAGGKGSDRAVALKLWAGDAIKKDRVNHEDRVPVRCPHPCLSLVGGIQPDMLREMADAKGRSDGFLDRFLFAYPDSLPVPEWSERGIADDVLDDWCVLVARLWSRPMAVKEGQSVPHVVRFSAVGKARWREHYDLHAAEMGDPGLPASLRGAWGKFRELAGRLALVLVLMEHAADPTADPAVVPEAGERVVDAAWRLVGYFKSHARRTHAAIARGPANADVPALLGWIVRRGQEWFRLADLTSDLRRFRDDQGALAAAIDELRRQGAIRPRPEPPDPSKPGRKPSPAYEIHPDLLDAPGNTAITANPQPDAAPDPNPGNSGILRRAEDDRDQSLGREAFEL